MRGMRSVLILVAVLLCFSLNSASAKRYMMSIHAASPLHMQRQHLGKMKVSFFKSWARGCNAYHFAEWTNAVNRRWTL